VKNISLSAHVSLLSQTDSAKVFLPLSLPDEFTCLACSQATVHENAIYL